MCDKSNETFLKILSLYEPDTREIVDLFIDFDLAGNIAEAATKPINHSFKTKLFGIMLIFIFRLTNDSGSGGTLHLLILSLAQIKNPIMDGMMYCTD